MKIFKTLILLAAIIIFNSCSNSFEPDTSVIQSLNVGDYWIYHVLVKKLPDNIIIQDASDTTFVVGQQVINNETWYKLSTSYLMINKDDGLWGRKDSLSAPEFIAPYPTTANSRYLRYSDDTSQVYLVTESVNTETEVIAGTFTCNVYKDERIEHDKKACECIHQKYYAPGIGLVKEITKTDRSEIVIQLVKFSKK
ncbi:MAG: hypothetical protein V4642_08665 [Bacteroidota bacterium]